MTMVVQNLTGVLTGPWREQLQERHTAACGKPGSRPGEHLPCSVTSWPSPSLLGPLAEPHRTPEAEDPARLPPRAQIRVEKVGLEGPMANALCITGWLGHCWKVTLWRQSQFIEGEVFCTDLFGAVPFCLELGAVQVLALVFPPFFWEMMWACAVMPQIIGSESRLGRREAWPLSGVAVQIMV